jgi:hypothetical protein
MVNTEYLKRTLSDGVDDALQGEKSRFQEYSSAIERQVYRNGYEAGTLMRWAEEKEKGMNSAPRPLSSYISQEKPDGST